MYQITAVYQGFEVAYAEADGFEYAKEEVMEQLSSSIYNEVMEDVILQCLAPNGMIVQMPAVI